MAISAGIFVSNIIAALGGTNLDLDLESETDLKVALFTNSVTPDFDASTSSAAYGAGVWASNEVSGTGYTAGGLVITSTTLTGSSGVMTFDSADPSWTSSTITSARGALIYNNALSPKSGIVVADLGADYSTANGTLLVQVASGGWFSVDWVP